MLAVIGAVGQAEREAMLERQREGIAKAKREGRYKGRVPTARRQAAEVARLKADGVRPSEIASGWVSAGPVCIGCWANRTPVSAKKLPDRECGAGPIIALRLTRCSRMPCGVAMTFAWYGGSIDRSGRTVGAGTLKVAVLDGDGTTHRTAMPEKSGKGARSTLWTERRDNRPHATETHSWRAQYSTASTSLSVVAQCTSPLHCGQPYQLRSHSRFAMIPTFASIAAAASRHKSSR